MRQKTKLDLFQRERLQNMKVKDLRKQSGTDWERLSTMTDKEIDFSDNQELAENFFANATLRMPEVKKAVSLRIDPDVLEWYKTNGPGYQTRINAVLRMYMQAKSGSSRRTPTRRHIRKNRTPIN
jgi:uncharacterized protein (DUF4415 family)